MTPAVHRDVRSAFPTNCKHGAQVRVRVKTQQGRGDQTAGWALSQRERHRTRPPRMTTTNHFALPANYAESCCTFGQRLHQVGLLDTIQVRVRVAGSGPRRVCHDSGQPQQIQHNLNNCQRGQPYCSRPESRKLPPGDARVCNRRRIRSLVWNAYPKGGGACAMHKAAS
eukprot:364449-Chlamydomonas_euryale.AAC.3